MKMDFNVPMKNCEVRCIFYAIQDAEYRNMKISCWLVFFLSIPSSLPRMHKMVNF
jgi:hypothetical protein